MANVVVTISGFGLAFLQAIGRPIICYSLKSPLSAGASSISVSIPELGWRKNRKSWQQYYSWNYLSRELIMNWDSPLKTLAKLIIVQLNFRPPCFHSDQRYRSIHPFMLLPLKNTNFQVIFHAYDKTISMPPARHIRSSPCWQTDITTSDPDLWQRLKACIACRGFFAQKRFLLLLATYHLLLQKLSVNLSTFGIYVLCKYFLK